MSEKWNPGGDDCLDLRQDRLATLRLYPLCPGGDQALGRSHRLLRRLVGLIRKVSDDEAAWHGPSHGGGVVSHFIKRHVRGVGVTQHDHPERVAHKNQRDAGGIKQLGHGEVIRRQRRDRLAALALLDGLWRLPCLAHAASLPPTSVSLKRKPDQPPRLGSSHGVPDQYHLKDGSTSAWPSVKLTLLLLLWRRCGPPQFGSPGLRPQAHGTKLPGS